MARQRQSQPPDPEWQADNNGELLRQHGLCGHQGCQRRMGSTFWIAWAYEFRKEPGFSVTACSRQCIRNWFAAYKKAVSTNWRSPRRPLVKKIKPERAWSRGRSRQPREPRQARQPRQPVMTACRCQGGSLPCTPGICSGRPQHAAGQLRRGEVPVQVTGRGPETGPPALGPARPKSVTLSPGHPPQPGTDVARRRGL